MAFYGFWPHVNGEKKKKKKDKTPTKLQLLEIYPYAPTKAFPNLKSPWSSLQAQTTHKSWQRHLYWLPPWEFLGATQSPLVFKAVLKIFPGTRPAPTSGQFLGTGLATVAPLNAKYPSRQVHRTTLGWPKPPLSQSLCPVWPSCWLMLSVHPLFGLSKGFFRGTQSLKRDRAPSLLLW